MPAGLSIYMMEKLSKKVIRMNRAILFVVMIMLLSASALATEIPSGVRITLLSQTPDPAGPGAYMDLRFKIENTGSDAISNLAVKLEEKYPLSLAGEKAEQFLGTLWGGLTEDYGITVKYRVKLDDNAPDGVNKVTLMYKSGTDTQWTRTEFDFDIRAIFDQVFVKAIIVVPEVIKAGESAEVKFSLVNLGETIMRDITVSLDLSSSTLPFVPLGEISQKRLKSLGSGEEGILTFKLRADPIALSKLYKIPITLTYYDILNNKFTKSDVLGLEVGGKPTIFVSLESSEIYIPGSTGNVVLSIVNNGETDVKFLKVEFPQTDGYVILDGKSQYIGNLNSDDFETAKIKVHLKSTSSKFELPVHLDYKDALGNFYSDDKVIQIPFYTRSESLDYGLTQRSNTLGWFIVLVIVIGGFFIYRNIKRRRRKP